MDPVNDNLKCPVCCSAFVEPITISCGHTYCLGCFRFKICPLDRIPIKLNWSQSRLVGNLVDELVVYCLGRVLGCPWKGQRSLLDHHVAKCQHVITSRKSTVSIDSGDSHLIVSDVTRPESPSPCSRRDSPISKSKCQYCNEIYVEIDNHQLECKLQPICCTYEKFGCNWVGQRKLLSNHHFEKCKLHPVSAFLSVYEKRYDELMTQNRALSARLDEQATLQGGQRAHDTNLFSLPLILENLTSEIRALRSELHDRDWRLDKRLGKDQQEIKDSMHSLRSSMQTMQVQLMDLPLNLAWYAIIPILFRAIGIVKLLNCKNGKVLIIQSGHVVLP